VRPVKDVTLFGIKPEPRWNSFPFRHRHRHRLTSTQSSSSGHSTPSSLACRDGGRSRTAWVDKFNPPSDTSVETFTPLVRLIYLRFWAARSSQVANSRLTAYKCQTLCHSLKRRSSPRRRYHGVSDSPLHFETEPRHKDLNLRNP